jgi:hypothetical protein
LMWPKSHGPTHFIGRKQEKFLSLGFSSENCKRRFRRKDFGFNWRLQFSV